MSFLNDLLHKKTKEPVPDYFKLFEMKFVEPNPPEDQDHPIHSTYTVIGRIDKREAYAIMRDAVEMLARFDEAYAQGIKEVDGWELDKLAFPDKHWHTLPVESRFARALKAAIIEFDTQHPKREIEYIANPDSKENQNRIMRLGVISRFELEMGGWDVWCPREEKNAADSKVIE